MMLKPLGVQLYSLRNAAAKDFSNVLKWVADVGYKSVEPAGFWNIRPSEFRKIVNDLGMEIYSSHSPWARPGCLGECMDTADMLGLKKIVCGFGADDFADLDAIKRTADTTNAMLDVLERNGYSLFQHNHYWEFGRIDGRLKYEIYRELCPRMKYQLDCFWSTNKGHEDAVEMLEIFRDDIVSLHMKDGITRQAVAVDGMKNGLLDCKIDLLPLGTGELPIPQLTAKAPDSVESIIVELDYCEEDMFSALKKSYDYMTRNHLASGNK